MLLLTAELRDKNLWGWSVHGDDDEDDKDDDFEDVCDGQKYDDKNKDEDSTNYEKKMPATVSTCFFQLSYIYRKDQG